MIRILGISGSLRRGSFNTALLRSAQALVPEGVTLEAATLHGIPLYDADVEQHEGIPPAVAALKSRMQDSHALLLATPEYNNGIPGVFKNAIDWLSRPPADVPRLFANRPVALIGASPGGFGTVLSQAAWLPVLRTLGMRLFSGGRILASHADKTVASGGEAMDPALRAQLADFLKKYAAFIDA